MADRLLITLAIFGAMGLVWFLWQVYKGRLIRSIQPSSEIDGFGQATLLYFTAAYCQVCKHQQTPVINELLAHPGNDLTVHTYDVSEQPEMAQRYKVLTLPTTVILSDTGQVADINYGLATRKKLQTQLAKVSSHQSAPPLSGQLQQAS